jgi:hypothetical protein
MRIAEFETVTPTIGNAVFPCRLEQRAATLGSAILLALMIPLALLLLTPLLVIAGQIATVPGARASLLAHPAGAAQVGVGLSLVIVFIAWPVLALLDRIGRRRIVLLDRKEVRVADTGLLQRRTWQQPVASYLGLAHHVRTTHAGVRHELVLVHPDRKASILLQLGAHLTEKDVTKLAARLGVPIVPPSLLYRRAPIALPPFWRRTATVCSPRHAAKGPLAAK